MLMTKKRPTTPGWYWYKLPANWPLQPVLVFDGGEEFGLMYTLDRIDLDHDDSDRDGLMMNDADPRTLWSDMPIIFNNRNTRQRQILEWANNTFGKATADNTGERIRRFAEEAIELAQAVGLDKQAMIDIIEHVYAKMPGNIAKEIGQVGVSLLGLAQHLNIDADEEERKEFERLKSLPTDYWQARQNAKAEKGIALKSTPEESCGSFN